MSQKDIDRMQAVTLITKGLDLPEDLKEKLLRYKQEDIEASKSNEYGVDYEKYY